MSQARVVFVTGASAGFGAAIAHRFAAGGALVVAAGRRLERMEPLRAEFGDAVHLLALDVRDRAAVAAAVAALPPAFAEIDVLVNNAGLAAGLEPAWQARLDDWDAMIDTNVKGLAYVTRAILPGMVERNRGLVVNIGSTAGAYPYPGANVYGGTKAFVSLFSLNLRADLHGTKVRVTELSPGMSGGTEFSTVRFRGDGERAAAVYANTTPLTAADVADTVQWIAGLPPHVNVNSIELMPVAQAFGPLAVAREETATLEPKTAR